MVVDYLQRMHTDKPCKSEEERMATLSACVRDIALYQKIPVLCLSSLSRANLLRGSGQLDYDHWGHIQIEKEARDGQQPQFKLSLDGQRFGPHFDPEYLDMHEAGTHFVERIPLPQAQDDHDFTSDSQSY